VLLPASLKLPQCGHIFVLRLGCEYFWRCEHE
jgi:hypothetical protein